MLEKRTELVSQVESTKVDNIKVRITDIVPIAFLNSNKVTIEVHLAQNRITTAVAALRHRYWPHLHSVCSLLPACSPLEYRRHLLLSFALGWPLACSPQGSILCEAFVVVATLIAAPTRCLLSPGPSACFLRGSRGSWAAIWFLRQQPVAGLSLTLPLLCCSVPP